MRARADKLEIETQSVRKERIPLSIILEEEDKIFKFIAGTLKANCDKTLTRELINEIFAEFRDMPTRLGWDLPPTDST
jgi:hypothetical protein